MRHLKKPIFFIVVLCIAAFTYLTLFGIHTQFGDTKTTYIKGTNDIRWGIDIRGGVDVTFSPEASFNATNDQIDAAKAVIETRLVSLGITDYEVYVDQAKDRIIVRFPWKSDEENFDPSEAVKEIGSTAMLTFREGHNIDDAGLPTGVTKDKIILEGKDVDKATPGYNNQTQQYIVDLKLTSDGAKKFAEATERLAGQDCISIWMDDVCFSYPNVDEKIPDGQAQISGGFTQDDVKALADKINSGALPFKLEQTSLSIIPPTLGMSARDAMVLSGIIGFALVSLFMLILYKVPGFVAVIALVGQVIGSIAAVTGFFGFVPSFTLTIPGIAGMILSIGMGVDANVITNERIKEEIRKGKTLDGSIGLGFERGFSAIFDGNITVIIVAIILMGAFGPPDSFFATIPGIVFSMFGPSTAGAVYSFGYTLLVGVICNFVFGVTASRLMLASISKFKFLRNPKLYGGVKHD